MYLLECGRSLYLIVLRFIKVSDIFGVRGGGHDIRRHRDLAPELKSLVFNNEVNKEINGFRSKSKT